MMTIIRMMRKMSAAEKVEQNTEKRERKTHTQKKNT